MTSLQLKRHTTLCRLTPWLVVGQHFHFKGTCQVVVHLSLITHSQQQCRSAVFLPNSMLQHTRPAEPMLSTLGRLPWQKRRATPIAEYASRMHPFTALMLITAISITLTAAFREGVDQEDFRRLWVWVSNLAVGFVTPLSNPFIPLGS